MNRVEEIIDIIFSLPEEEREEVERGIKKRKKGLRKRYFHSLEDLKRMRDSKLKDSGEQSYHSFVDLAKMAREKRREELSLD